MNIMTDLSTWFWNERVWLPPNVTWEDLAKFEGSSGNHRKFSDLWYPIPAAIIVILVRSIFERTLFRPLGIYCGLRQTPHRRAPTNDVLETAYTMAQQERRKISNDEITSLAQTLGMTTRRVERWLRQRNMQSRPTTLEKFAETGWRFFFYTTVFIYGIVVLWNKSWLWDVKNCWYGYPHHSVERDVWWYYIIEMAFYWSLCISQFFDVKRKDFAQMFIHHITTIALMALSWTCNLTRVGTLVLVVHDCADIFLEAAKMCKYTNHQTMCNTLFGIFAVTWIITRLGVYPTHILYSTTIEAPQIVQMFPSYYIFNFLLSTLLVLHVIWTYLILRIIYKAAFSGVADDVRSDSEDDTLSSSSDANQESNGQALQEKK